MLGSPPVVHASITIIIGFGTPTVLLHMAFHSISLHCCLFLDDSLGPVDLPSSLGTIMERDLFLEDVYIVFALGTHSPRKIGRLVCARGLGKRLL